jgi:serine/threonine-protein kinase ATR
MQDDPQLNEDQQQELLLGLGKIACAGSYCLRASTTSQNQWRMSTCTRCDTLDATAPHTDVYWEKKHVGDDWKHAIAAMLVITKEAKFQSSPKARVLMAIAIGRVFNHIADVDYLKLETCELGQWLLGSLSRSLRELKLAAAYVLSSASA